MKFSILSPDFELQCSREGVLKDETLEPKGIALS